MDIISFITTQRNQALLLGDYNAYRSMCSRRLATLRKRLGRSNTKSKKYVQQPPISAEDLARDKSYAELFLFASERAWAHGMHMKALSSEDPDSASGSVRGHIVSRLHKAFKYATELYNIILSSASSSTDKDVLEAAAYASALRGAGLFEKSHWEDALRAFAVSHIVYTALLGATKNDIYKEQLTATIDPSVRYSAYQLQLPRNMDISAISKRYFPRDSSSRVMSAIEELDPQAFSDAADNATPGAGTVTSVAWRGRTAPTESADISIALSNAQGAEKAYDSEQSENSTDAFDSVLSAWQDAVDATRKAIDECQAEGMGMGEQKMQNLQLTWTVVNYSMICWRVGRNRVMVKGISQGRRNDKRDGGEVRGKRLGHLKEEVTLYDAILQSLDQVVNLPGVAADETFTAELDAKKAYFSALRCASIARSHALLANTKNALALFYRAATYVSSSLSALPKSPVESSHKGLEISPAEAHELHSTLQGEVSRFRALVEMESLAAKAPAVGKQPHGVLLERLDVWPENVDFENGLVSWPPKLEPIPVKPVFLDIAWNYIEYPGSGERKQQAQASEKKEEKKGFLGRFW